MPPRNQTREKVILRVQRFSELVAQRGWQTDIECGKALGVSPSVISKLRAGKISPSGITIDKIVTGLEAPYSTLFVRVEEP